MDALINNYNIKIYEKIKDLLNAGKTIDHFNYKSDLHKIFEWLSCIKLTKEYKTPFYEYNDIPPNYKEQNNMSKNDTGVDACNLIDTIVQCKLRTHSLRLEDLGTFLLNGLYTNELDKIASKWINLLLLEIKNQNYHLI
jgi:hypothetical protein